MTFKPLNLRSTLHDLGLCALAFVVLLLALLLSEVRHARQQVVGELKLLSQTTRNQLDRPSLLDAAHYARLTALGQGIELLARRLDGQWLIGAGGVDSKTLDRVSLALQSLAAQRKAFADLAQVMEQLAHETVAGDRPLPGAQSLCGEDVSVVDMPRLRGILGDRLVRANAGESGRALGLGRGASAQRLQEALALVDQFMGLRRDALALLEESAAPATAGASDVLINGLAVLALLLALAAGAQRVLRPGSALAQPVPELAPPAPPAVVVPTASDTTEPTHLPPAVLPEPPIEAPPHTAEAWPAPASGVLIDEERWHDLRESVAIVCEAGVSLERLARSLVDGTGQSSQQAEGELVTDLLQLADLLQRAREGTVNLALSRLAGDADAAQVEALERLDGLLLTTVAALAKLEDLRDQRETLAEPRSVVPRRDLVRLQSDLQHLVSQLGVLQGDVSAAVEHSGAAPI
jgi:hypothetical protein